MKTYKTIETYELPPNTYKSIEEFKEDTFTELQKTSKLSNTYQKDKNLSETLPLPIYFYVLFTDFSAAKIMVISRTKEEKQTLVIAAKQRIKQLREKKTALYGVIVMDVFMSSFTMSEEDKNLSQKDLSNKFNKELEKGKDTGTTVSRIMVRFEDPVNQIFEVHSYMNIEGILSEQDAESLQLTTASNLKETREVEGNLLNSIFDYSEKYVREILNTVGDIPEIKTFNLEQAVERVKNFLQLGSK